MSSGTIVSVKIHELSGNILYIENAFPLAAEFVKAIEENDQNGMINSIIPQWSDWFDGYVEDGIWQPKHHTGFIKEVNWDYSVNHKNSRWPRVEIKPDQSESYQEAYNIIKMIDEPYKDVLDIWSKKTNNEKLELITKNYTIKKYNPGGNIGTHIDKANESDTFDWTALVYLNDDYSGGDIVFNNLGHRISPSAGSILIFPADEPHTAEMVTKGNKYFIFFYIQSKYKFTHSLREHTADYIKNLIRYNFVE